jgi:lambda family phage tail tape measure protein
MAAALVASVSAAVLGGFVKLLTIMKELNTVVSKNKLITIIGAILAVASGASAYLGLTRESVDEQEKLNKEVDKTRNATQETQRDQQGLLDIIKKQRDSLTQVTEQYLRQRQSAQDRLDLELESLNLSEEQRRVKQETAQIEEQTQSALLSLKQKYEALDEASRKNRAQDYARERDLIIQNGEASKRTTEERIRAINSERAILEDLQKQYSVYTDARVKLLEKVARAEIEAGRFQDRASQEEKLNTILAQRARLMEAVAKSNLTPEDQEKIKKAIADATGNTKLMEQGFQDIQRSIEGAILATEGLNEAQRQAANDILLNTQNSRNTITAVGEAMAIESQRIQDYQRSFTTGWSRAFQQYADDATNAAKRAEQIFTKVTQGLEDAFVNFAKTGKLSFRDLINSIIEDLLRSQIRQLLAQTFNFGGGAGGGSNIFSSIGKIFGFASGGVVPGNKPILVGERGPEIFMPPGAGNIIPNNQLGGGTTIYYNISAVDARSFQELVARDPQFIYAVTEQGRRSLPQTRR